LSEVVEDLWYTSKTSTASGDMDEQSRESEYGMGKIREISLKKWSIEGMENCRYIPQMKREKAKGKVREWRMKIESLGSEKINSPVHE
jgi:hypothetical protein